VTAKNKAVWRETLDRIAELVSPGSSLQRALSARQSRGPLGSYREAQESWPARVLPDLTHLDRGAVRWAVRIGVRHTRFLNATVALSRTRMLGGS